MPDQPVLVNPLLRLGVTNSQLMIQESLTNCFLTIVQYIYTTTVKETEKIKLIVKLDDSLPTYYLIFLIIERLSAIHFHGNV